MYTHTPATTAKDIITKSGVDIGADKELPSASGLNGTATELASGVVTYAATILVSLSFVCS